MPDYVVLDHHVDEATEVYRLLIGEEIVERHARISPDGSPVMQQVKASDGSGRMVEQPEIEEERRIVYQEEFVFAVNDDRWAGQSPEDIASRQRQIVTEQLSMRRAVQEAEARRRASVQEMPGIGDPL